jgi:uncharacterized membrane protein HdeD (DUF308 family)
MSSTQPPAAAAQALKSHAGVIMLLGIALILLGVLALFSPMAAGLAATIFLGALLLVAGIVRTVFSVRTRGGIPSLLLGILALVAGLLIVTRPLFGLMSLTLILGWYFLVDGVMEIMAAFRLRPGSGWQMWLFGGVVSILLGAIILSEWPLSGTWVVGVLLAVKLLMAGMMLLGLGSAARRIAKAAGG